MFLVVAKYLIVYLLFFNNSRKIEINTNSSLAGLMLLKTWIMTTYRVTTILLIKRRRLCHSRFSAGLLDFSTKYIIYYSSQKLQVRLSEKFKGTRWQEQNIMTRNGRWWMIMVHTSLFSFCQIRKLRRLCRLFLIIAIQSCC